MTPEIVWLILAFPFLAFLVIVFGTWSRPRLSGYTTIAGIGLAGVVSYLVFFEVLRRGAEHPLASSFPWLGAGSVVFPLGIVVDPLTAMMLLVVTTVSFLIQVYSQGYMHGDAGYSRFFAYMALFTTSMLGLVLADNLLMLFIFWELVGLCSYLLIGFWFKKPEAAAAAKKAFIVTRLGDLGLLVGLLYLFAQGLPYNFAELNHLAEGGKIAGTVVTIAALLIFAGAVGKSAQFPLHVWLPDAMEGPTPVSALIHAATMVAAGVYLVGRTFPLFHASHDASLIVAVIGAVTAILAASMGLVMTDIKRVMAYSTISQLGYMMLGLGVGGFAAGLFHLFNHAFFKALLFLCSGSVIHGTGTQDMREMGGLRRYMPWTFLATTIGGLSLAGVPPLSGFWSKDEILADALHEGQVGLFWIAVVAAVMTAFYVFRMIFLTFSGAFRGPHPRAPSPAHMERGHGGEARPHESPAVMVLPLLALAVPSVVTGFLNVNGTFTQFLEPKAHFAGIDPLVAGISIGAAGLGILLATLMYWKPVISPASVRSAFRPVHSLLVNKYWLDYLYEDLIVRRLVTYGLFALAAWFDRTVVDGLVNGVAHSVVNTGAGLRRLQTGQAQAYALAIGLGVLLVLAGFMFTVG